MPTSDANAYATASSSSSPLTASSLTIRNANITELAVEEADSFKANVSTMTQDHCLDNGHETKSNSRSSSDKVSDDLDNSKNSVVSNGVNSVVQEFNVDVDREYSTDLLIVVQNRTAVDTDSPPTGKVSSSTSKQLTETPSDFVDSRDISENSINNIDANKSECKQNIVADMTVITHQNSSENIRDIISNSEKANKNSSDSQSQLGRVESSANSDVNDINSRSVNKSTGIPRNRKLTRSTNVNESEDGQIEDPIERLNKLRASISNALSEVKGVLKQYSTEQSCDEQNESAPSKQPPDDGPVRFRFVRKIRRRSVFSEDDETEIAKPSAGVTTSLIIENKVIEEVPSELQEISKTLSNENQDLIDQNKDNNAISPQLEETKKSIEEDTNKTDKKLLQSALIVNDKSDIVNNTVSEIQKTTKETSSVGEVEVVTGNASETAKSKIGKTKKVLKKDRRASIAAVEINQISIDESPIALEVKTQRRPSDSGTLVKQTTTTSRIKAKTSEKQKSTSNRKAKTVSSSITESSPIKSSQTSKTVEKKDLPLAPPEQKTSLTVDSTSVVDEKLKKETKTSVLDLSRDLSQETTSNESPAIVKTKTNEGKIDPGLADLFPTVLTKAATNVNVKKLNKPDEVAPASAAVVSPKVEADMIQTSLKETKVNKSEATTEVKLSTSEVAPAPAVSSSVKAIVPETSPKANEVKKSEAVNADISQTLLKLTEANKSEATGAVKLNTSEVPPTPVVSSTVDANLPKASSEVTEVNKPKATSAVKLNTPEVPPIPTVNVNKPEVTSAVELNTPEVALPVPDSSTMNADILQASPKAIEVKSNKLEIAPATAVPEKSDSSVKPKKSEVPIQVQQSQKTNTEPTKVMGIPNHQTTKSQGSKTGVPVKKPNTPVPTASQTKVPDASHATAKLESSKIVSSGKEVVKTKTVSPLPKESNKQTNKSIEASKAAPAKSLKTVQVAVTKKTPSESVNSNVAKQIPKHNLTTETSKVAAKSKVDTHENHQVEDTSSIESEVPIPSNVPKDAVAVKFNLPSQESVEELQRLEEQQQQNKETSPPEASETTETTETTVAAPKKKRKAKRKVIIRRIKRKLSKDDTFLLPQEAASELEIEEKDIVEPEPEEEEVPEGPKEPKSCLKKRQYEIGDVVMYAEHYKKTQVRWKKAVVTERITSISYKLNIEGDERPAHISYIKKFNDRKVNFGGKEYLEIDYAQIEDEEEKERNYSIWNLV